MRLKLTGELVRFVEYDLLQHFQEHLEYLNKIECLYGIYGIFMLCILCSNVLT